MKQLLLFVTLLLVLIMVNCRKPEVDSVKSEESNPPSDTIVIETENTIGLGERIEFYNLKQVVFIDSILQVNICNRVSSFLMSEKSRNEKTVLISQPYPTAQSIAVAEMIEEAAQFGSIFPRGGKPYGYFYNDDILFIVDVKLSDWVRELSDHIVTVQLTVADYYPVPHGIFSWKFDRQGNEIHVDTMRHFFDTSEGKRYLDSLFRVVDSIQQNTLNQIRVAK